MDESEDFAACLPVSMEPVGGLIVWAVNGPPTYNSWPRGWSARIDAYLEKYGGTRAALFRRISEISGNSVNGLSLRYYRERKIDVEAPRSDSQTNSP